MIPEPTATTEWVILTRGDRAGALAAAIGSIGSHEAGSVLVVSNGGGAVPVDPGTEAVELPENVGIPGGRSIGVEHTKAAVVCFLDDDAGLRTFDAADLLARFEAEPDLAVVCFRLVDEGGRTSRRHVPRAGRRGVEVGGDVATFLGGACAVRRSAYDDVGGYWADLWYGHEELDLAWRLIDGGYRVSYDPRFVVFHPRTEIGRHASGWRLTGRNRVWIARRDLPWTVAIAHVSSWLVLGLARAPRGCRRAYLAGWWSGWSGSVPRRAIRWRTVLALARLGRPPVI
jgi:GT2 family glycosyltransferase